MTKKFSVFYDLEDFKDFINANSGKPMFLSQGDVGTEEEYLEVEVLNG